MTAHVRPRSLLRSRLVASLCLAALVVATAAWGSDAPAAAQTVTAAKAPNVLLIVTDDQRENTFRVMPETSRLLLEKGTFFTEAFATSPLCCPSRATIMTGQYPHNHQVRRNEDSGRLVHESTLQYYLQQEGYLTGIIGKYLNAWRERDANPPYFDRWAVIDDYSYGHVYRHFTANVNGNVIYPLGYSTGFIEDKSVSFLRHFEKEDDRPWFLYVAPFASHKPFRPEHKYRKAPVPLWLGNPAVGEGNRSDKPPWVQQRYVGLDAGRGIARNQQRTLMSVDDMVARTFEVLDKLDETRDTLVVFISDNGYMWGEHGLAAKRFPYTQAIRVPIIVRWPGVVAAGATDDSLVGNIDVAPTILEAAGAIPNPDYPIDGHSLFTEEPRREILLEYFGSRLGEDIPAWAAIRSATHQYVEYYNALTGIQEFTEYYDLVGDPWQLVNLLGDGDPTNDPPAPIHSLNLQETRDCRGADCP